MALNFKMYERTSTELETIGTVATVIGKGGSLRFVPGTFTSGKRIAIILQNKKGESTVIACSKRVSEGLKSALDEGTSKKQMLSAISKLEVSEDEEGRNFIIAPVGSGGVEEAFTIEDLNKVTTSFEDLVAF
jgi:hypothetical protein